MFAKLFSRITESSLMEEEIAVRYTFIVLLAIADATGHVIGTDVAIARRLNMEVSEFKRCVSELMQPDADSNSQEEEGRRVLESKGERGYYLVNYTKYRELRDNDHRREYMRSYMQKRRGKQDVNSCKQDLATSTHAEGDAEGEETHPGDLFEKSSSYHTKVKTAYTPEFEAFWDAYPKEGRAAKPKAFTSFKPHSKQLSEILTGLKKHSVSHKWQKDGGQFIPNPATFLNQQQWKDEPKSAPQTNRTPHTGSPSNAGTANRNAAADYNFSGSLGVEMGDDRTGNGG